jgi:hypothetical protein
MQVLVEVREVVRGGGKEVEKAMGRVDVVRLRKQRKAYWLTP